MNLCPCLSKNEMPDFLIKAKQLRLDTSMLANIAKECHTGERDDLKCAVNSPECQNCVEGNLFKKRAMFKLI